MKVTFGARLWLTDVELVSGFLFTGDFLQQSTNLHALTNGSSGLTIDRSV